MTKYSKRDGRPKLPTADSRAVSTLVSENAEKFPRVLFITTSAFNKVTGGGVTFSNLFAGWPQERIATAHTDTVPVSTDVCSRYFKLGEGEIHKQGVLRRFMPVQSGGVENSQNAETRDRMLLTVARAVKKVLFGNAIPDAGELTPELESWVAAYKPEILYTILGTNAMMDLAKALCARFDIPLVIHLMDDWPTVAYRGGLLSWFSRRRMQKLLRELVTVAEVRIGICEEMAKEYEKRYGPPFLAYQNAIDSQKWRAYEKKNLSIGEQVRLLYIGSILPNAQLDALADCCMAVAKLRSEGMNIVLDIYSPTFYTQLLRQKLALGAGIRLHEPIVTDEEVFTHLAEADILLLPVNFDLETVRYIKYSMPTKVPAYLFCGTPVLVYGSRETAQVKYAQRAGWGYVVSERGPDQVASAIRELTYNIELRTRLSRAAHTAAFSFHDASIVRTQFQRTLCKSVRKRKLR